LSSAEVYDPLADRWQPVALMSSARSGATATRLGDGRVLVVGGLDGANTNLATGEVYDPVANTWTPVDSAHPLSAGRADAGSALLSDGDVLIVGGSLGASTFGLANVDLYNPTTNTFTPAPPLSVGRAFPVVTALSDGKVLVAGGSDANGSPLDTAEVYLPNTNSWTPVANTLSAPRLGAAAAVLAGGHVLIAGGLSAVSPFSADSGSDIYDAATNRFTPGPAMSTPRALLTLTTLANGQVLAAGGANIVAGSPTALASTELYDTAHGTWSSGPSLSTARFQQSAAPTPDGGAAIIGGSDSAGTATTSVDRYVPALPPAAPVSPSATAVSGAAFITWAPPFNGGSPITRYLITASPGGAMMTITSGATGALFTGLTNGTTYTFTVTATNQLGTSPAATTNPVTPTAPAVSPPAAHTPPPPAPRLKLSGLSHHIRLTALTRGLRLTVTPNTPQSLDVALIGATTTATLARAVAYDVTIAHAHRGLSSGSQHFVLRVPARLIGRARNFTLRLIIKGTGDAGNSTTISWTLSVAPGSPPKLRK
jgi:fibronectin type III domain protein/Kelch motif protein